MKNQTDRDDDRRYHRHSPRLYIASFLISYIREKPFATGNAHFINPDVITLAESNLLDDRIGAAVSLARDAVRRSDGPRRESQRAFFTGTMITAEVPSIAAADARL